MQKEAVITAVNLSKIYQQYKSPAERLKSILFGKNINIREFIALKNVSFTIYKGETVGIVGRNGSGKSTLLQIIANTVLPTTGSCLVVGRLSALLELGAGFNPEFSGRENIFLNGAILGLSDAQIKEKLESIIEFSGIGDFIDQPVKTYSSGMFIRLAFSIAISTDPEILIVDEALAVGDEAFQRKCYSRLENFKAKGGTLVFVSHSAQAILEVCERALLMDSGELLLDGNSKQVVELYQRLIFSPPERQSEIKNEIRFGKNNVAVESSEILAHTTLEKSASPETTVSYPSQGAHISSPRITDLSGNEVNVLTQNERYVYRYHVKFDVEAHNVTFGMLIKNTTGIPIGGAGGAGIVKQVEKIKSGDEFEVEFEFNCSLTAGTYFLNCGCIGYINGEYTYLHRILDACMFRVLADANSFATGMVDFGIAVGLRKG